MRMPRFIPFFAILLAAVCVVLLVQPITPGVGATRRLAPTAHTSGVTTITTDTIVIPTYSYASALFTSTNTTYNIPYQWLHWGEYDKTGRTKSDRAYTRLTLENDWLRVSILPELGGRVYELIYKPTGSNELYRNPVIKPTNWGPTEQGWWLAAGGIEWGLPVEEHGYETALPWTYTIAQTSEGSGVTLRDSTDPDRLRATVEVFLPDDRAVLIVRPTIENARGVPLDFKWWDNAMLAPGPNNTVGPELRFVFPIDAVTVHSTNDDRLPGHGWPGPTGPDYWITWPLYNAVDWSRLSNFDEWFGFFGRPQAQQDFVGVYDTAADEGVVRIFPHQTATGIKGFAMGWAHPIGSGEWTDDGSTYVELHGGLAPTFWDSVGLNPGQSIEWEEVWYPVAGIGNISTATGEAALKVESADPYLHIGLFATRPHTWGRLTIYQRSTCAFLRKYEFGPFGPSQSIFFTPTITTPLDDVTMFASADGTSALADYNPPVGGPAPTVFFDPLVPVHTSNTFAVVWLGEGCVRSFDVQVRDGFDGAWTPWFTDTMWNSAIFTGTHGHTYYFRARVRGLSGSLSDYQDETFTTVLLTPSAVMETSRLNGPAFFEPGQPVSFTLILSNTGNLTGNIAATNTLPVSMTLIPGSLSTSTILTPTFDGTRILWRGVITDNTSVLITYALTPTVDLGFMQPQTNTVVIDGGIARVTRTAVTAMARFANLPLVTRAYTP